MESRRVNLTTSYINCIKWNRRNYSRFLGIQSMLKCLANTQKLGPKLSNVTSTQLILLWRIKFEVNSTNSRQLCRTDRSHFWQDFYVTKFWSKFGFRQQYSPRRLQDSLSSNFIYGLNLKWIFDRRLCFFGPWHKTIFQTFLLTFCDRDLWKSQKKEGPWGYSRYIGSSAWAKDFPAFIALKSFDLWNHHIPQMKRHNLLHILIH